MEYYLATAPFNTASVASLSAIGTTTMALNYGLVLPNIFLCQRFPHLVQWGIRISLAVYVLSFIIASFVDKVWELILFQGILAGLSGGLAYAPVYYWLAEWFVERRSLAGGSIFAGAGLGGFIFPIMLRAILPKIGFRWTLRVFALLNAILCGVALMGIKPRKTPVKPPKGAVRGIPIDFRVFLDPVFLLLGSTVFIQGLLYSPLTVYLPTYSAAFASPLAASFTLSLLNIASTPGQIFTGGLCDIFPYPYVMLGSGLLSVVGIFAILRVADTLAKVLGLSILLGATAGGFSSCWFPACTDVAGPQTHQSGAIFGYLSLVRGAASIIGPLIAAGLYDPKSMAATRWGKFGLGQFVQLVGWLAVATAGGSVAVELGRRWRRWKRAKA
ncbi:MFS general substrate transporter [Pseudohyphozyma bogoriensis]|nr:MFS general substrate transporter [Pseudohyphozyma bogoriensis]